jgi:Zn-finger nucleic acid-binding protein
MDKYYTAETYKNWERIGKPYDKGWKLYTKIKIPCPRCSGTGIYAIGVENGEIKPHPAYNGVCLQCGSLGYLEKEARLYTESEYNTMQKNKEREHFPLRRNKNYATIFS